MQKHGNLYPPIYIRTQTQANHIWMYHHHPITVCSHAPLTPFRLMIYATTVVEGLILTACISLNPVLSRLVKLLPVVLVLIGNASFDSIIRLGLEKKVPRDS